MFCGAARYRRAAAGNSHAGAHPDNLALHTGAVHPTPALWRAASSYRPVRAMAVRKCSKCCQLFLVFRGRALYVRGMMHPCILVGPSRQRRGLVSCLDGPALLESHVAFSPWRRRIYIATVPACFEPQRASPFMFSLVSSPPFVKNVCRRTAHWR
jgi:hypothetical protein